MQQSGYQPISDWARRHFRRGKTEGREEGLAGALLDVLAARDLDASPEIAARIEACTDLDVLRAWLRRAATARSLDDVFSE